MSKKRLNMLTPPKIYTPGKEDKAKVDNTNKRKTRMSRKMAHSLERTGLKHCGSCNQILPMTEDYFYRDKNGRGGFKNMCKECFRRKQNEKHGLSNPIEGLTMEQALKLVEHTSFANDRFGKDYSDHEGPTKQCYDCKKVFPANSDFFYNDKRKPDGLNTYCKPCHYEHMKKSKWMCNERRLLLVAKLIREHKEEELKREKGSE